IAASSVLGILFLGMMIYLAIDQSRSKLVVDGSKAPEKNGQPGSSSRESSGTTHERRGTLVVDVPKAPGTMGRPGPSPGESLRASPNSGGRYALRFDP